MRVALIQMSSGGEKRSNLHKAAQMLREAARRKADLAVLPEMFNFLPRRMTREECLPNAEEEGGETLGVLSEVSKETGVAIVAGSIIEKDEDKLYNTAFVVTERGITGRYRKNHLFSYSNIREGDVFTPGGAPAVVELCGMRAGITICYDLRFPELFRAEVMQGAEALVNVAAFLEETGKAHWMPLLRARAIENLAYVIAANQAGVQENNFKYYGHSCIIDPWGKVARKAGFGEKIIFGKVGLRRVQEVRERLPVLKNHKQY